jgi:hypothetical protein
VPETPIHKHSDFLSAENKIRFSKYRLTAAPACNMVNAKQFYHSQLSGSVALPANAGHDFRALGFVENIATQRRFHLSTPQAAASTSAG